MKWGNLLKDKGSPYWWKDEEMVWLCSKGATNTPVRKSEFIQVKGTKKGWGRPKITLVEVIKNDMSIKEVTQCMTLDGIEWWKRTCGWP